MDIFSWFHWLAPLTTKEAVMWKIYKFHGIPKRLQSDNGGKVKNEVKRFCKINKIKMIRLHLYNLKSRHVWAFTTSSSSQSLLWTVSAERKKTGVNWVKSCKMQQKRVDVLMAVRLSDRFYLFYKHLRTNLRF